LTKLNKDQINEIIWEYIQESIDTIKEHYATTKQTLTPETLSQQLISLAVVIEDLMEVKAYRKRSAAYPQVDDLLEAKGVAIDRDSDLYQWMGNRMLTAEIALADFEYQVLLGKEAVTLGDDLEVIMEGNKKAQPIIRAVANVAENPKG
jgi:hypothetical protein